MSHHIINVDLFHEKHFRLFFQKLMQGMDCTSVNAALFRRKHFANQKVKLISQKQGLPIHTRYLAGNNTTGSLFLTDSRNTNNMFKFRRLTVPCSNY